MFEYPNAPEEVSSFKVSNVFNGESGVSNREDDFNSVNEKNDDSVVCETPNGEGENKEKEEVAQSCGNLRKGRE